MKGQLPMLVRLARGEMQETYKVFSKVSGELKVESREQYDKLLGV